MYFDTADASSPTFSISALEIFQVEETYASNDPTLSHSGSSGSSSGKGFGFTITAGKRKSELRASTEEDRDGWMGALAPFAKESSPLSSPHAHHPKSRSSTLSSFFTSTTTITLCCSLAEYVNYMNLETELAKVADYLKQQLAVRKKKQFSADEGMQLLSKKYPQLNESELKAWGQALLDAKLIHVISSSIINPNCSQAVVTTTELNPHHHFGDHEQPEGEDNNHRQRKTSSMLLYGFPEKKNKSAKWNHTISGTNDKSKLSKNISDLMSKPGFDAKVYAEQFLKRANTSAHLDTKIEDHCETLLDQKETIIEELKDDICANYTTFLIASLEIRKMENCVSSMKAAMLECKRSLHRLQSQPLAIALDENQNARTRGMGIHKNIFCYHPCVSIGPVRFYLTCDRE
jgi:hypothetical protein